MKKNIEWLKEEITEILLTSKKDGTNYFYYKDLKEKIYNAIDQLDKLEVLSSDWIDKNQHPYGGDYHVPSEKLEGLLTPIQNKVELACIPQIIADWLEECKGWNDDEQIYDEDNAINLLGAIDLDSAGMSDEVYDYLVDNSETFAKAWFFGYKIKENREFLVTSNGLDGVVHYFTRFDDEMNALVTLPNSKRNAYKFKDKVKAQSIADYIDGEVKEV